MFREGERRGGERGVGGDVFGEEGAADGAGGEDAEVAAEPTPFGEVVGYVEGGGGRDGVFVVYEGDGFDGGGLELDCVGVVGEEDYVAAEEVSVAEDELCGDLLVVALVGDRWGFRWHTPSSPRPGVSPSSDTVRSSSSCNTFFRLISASLVVGRANTHFCIMVHTLGVGFPGVMALICSKEGDDFGASKVSGISCSASSMLAVRSADMIGKVACHSPSLRATPRQTGSRVKSSDVHTRPLMNLYMRPFWKRASSAGASLCCESSEWDTASSVQSGSCQWRIACVKQGSGTRHLLFRSMRTSVPFP